MTDKPEPSAFEKFGRMLGKILQVPKDEIAEDEREVRKENAPKEEDRD